ncbi:putative phage abortive infection protein [Aeromonas caviae]|uniref:putative phage abortive infection protein n=1 Tax=Aeromonas caviae TaxID=648 RepID=UPI0015DD3F13|nr:putative phage abortive infection protein [Aeromonas caviae]BBR10115.1 hypothetical protein WP3S18E02_17760 [Aeromonas caviae]
MKKSSVVDGVKGKAWLFLIVLILWGLYPFAFRIQSYLNIGNGLPPNEFGDMYGALNTLFSGLAFAGVIISIRLQSQELTATRKEMEGQGEQFKQQTSALKKQVFDAAFFRLQSFNIDMLQSLTFKIAQNWAAGVKEETVIGQQVISHFSDELESALRTSIMIGTDSSNISYSTSETYKQLHSDCIFVLDHYFRNVYQVLKLVDDSNLDGIEKKNYSDLLRSQMTSEEIWILFYDCLSERKHNSFKILLEKYEFFEFMLADSVMVWRDMLEYDLSVFGWSNRGMFEKYLMSIVSSDDEWRGGRRILAVYDGDPAEMDISDLPLESIEKDIKERRIIWVAPSVL